MTSNGSDTAELDPRRRAFVHFDAVARLTDEVPVTTRLHCLAAADELGGPRPQMTSSLSPVAGGEVEAAIRVALAELGSLPLDEFVAVRAAARHGRRALRALR